MANIGVTEDLYWIDAVQYQLSPTSELDLQARFNLCIHAAGMKLRCNDTQAAAERNQFAIVGVDSNSIYRWSVPQSGDDPTSDIYHALVGLESPQTWCCTLSSVTFHPILNVMDCFVQIPWLCSGKCACLTITLVDKGQVRQDIANQCLATMLISIP